MTHSSSQETDMSVPAGRDAATAADVPGPGRSPARHAQRWARTAVAAQVVFTASWLLAAAWQGSPSSQLTEACERITTRWRHYFPQRTKEDISGYALF
jgi:hypothetical protein